MGWTPFTAFRQSTNPANPGAAEIIGEFVDLIQNALGQLTECPAKTGNMTVIDGWAVVCHDSSVHMSKT